MAIKLKTHLYCYDDHRAFSEDVRKRFDDGSRYTVISFQTKENFLSMLEKEKEYNFCKVAILGVHDTPDQIQMMENLTNEVKRIDPLTGLILIVPPDKQEEIKKVIKYNIDAFVPKNANTILRVHNTVKKLISEHSIGIFRKRRNISLYILTGFLIIAAIVTAVAYFRMPHYF
jgi:hypothetical protein